MRIFGEQSCPPRRPCVKITSVINENMDGRKHSGEAASEAEERGTGTRPQAPLQPLRAAHDSSCRALVHAGPSPWNARSPLLPEERKTSESSNILSSVKRSATTPIDRHHALSFLLSQFCIGLASRVPTLPLSCSAREVGKPLQASSPPLLKSETSRLPAKFSQ